MIVKCVICGYEAIANPGSTVRAGLILKNKKIYKNYPTIWICDIHRLEDIEYIEL